jgi:hypothetical protein
LIHRISRGERLLTAEIDVPKSPSPPRRGNRDDSAGTLFKLAGTCCVTLCGCIFAPILLLLSLPLVIYGGGYLAFLSIICIVIGCFSAKYTYEGIQKASG